MGSRFSRLGAAALVALAALVLDVPAAGAGIPPTPPRCVGDNLSPANDTDVAIPSGPSVATSTIDVSGADPYLFKLRVGVSIDHTFPADLDVTVTSPEGTVVTLTTDNAATQDDSFSSTYFGDEADPDGQVPYTSNDGLVTDHLYTGAEAFSLVPEEAISAFRGEDPNGTWTLTISDDQSSDAGTLQSWRLDLSTLDRAPVTTFRTFVGPAVAVPAGPAVVSSSVQVAGVQAYLHEVEARTELTHTNNADVDMTLASPSGKVVTLTTDNGGVLDDVFNGTIWDDDADQFGQVPYVTNDGLATDHPYADGVVAGWLVPEEAMGAFQNDTANGTWTLTISDDEAQDAGNLAEWSVTLVSSGCPQPDARVRVGKSGPLAGNDVYNQNGQDQTRTVSRTRGQTVTFLLPVQNDTAVAQALRVKGAASSPHYQVTYRNLSGANVTQQVKAGTYTTPVLAPGKAHTVKAVVKVKQSAPRGSAVTRGLRATIAPEGGASVTDLARFVVRRA